VVSRAASAPYAGGIAPPSPGGKPLVSADAEVALIDEIAQAMRDASNLRAGANRVGSDPVGLEKLGLVRSEAHS